MSLLNRRPISIGREQREFKDDRFFMVATDDTHAPKQYFQNLAFRRVKIFVLPTSAELGDSAPAQVVERLKTAFLFCKERKEVREGDEFWVLLDRDHHFQASHTPGTREALRAARQAGFEVAISNPCFELWLLLHHQEPAPDSDFKDCKAVEAALRNRLGSYNKTNLLPSQFPIDLIPDAIHRAKALEKSPDEILPRPIGTRVYRLLEKILPATP
jgi:hypothetical protein